MEMPIVRIMGSTKLNEEQATYATEYLKEKYKENFIVDKIGARFNRDGAKLYVYPENNRDILFTVYIDKYSKEISEDYIEQKVNHQVIEKVKDALTSKKMIVDGYSVLGMEKFLNPENKEFTPESFYKAYDFGYYAIYLIIDNENINVKDFYETLVNVATDLSVNLVFMINIFDKDNYKLCSDELKEYPALSLTMIEKHSPIKSFSMSFKEGKSSFKFSDFQKEVGEN